MFSSGKFSNHVNKSRVLYAWIMILILFFMATIGLTLAFFYNDDWGSNGIGTSGPVKIEAVGRGDVSIEDDRSSRLVIELDPTYGNVILPGEPMDITANCKVFKSSTNPLVRALVKLQFLDVNTNQIVTSNNIINGYNVIMMSHINTIIDSNGWYLYNGFYYYIGTDGVKNAGDTILKEVQFDGDNDTVLTFLNDTITFPGTVTSSFSGYKIKFTITFQAIQNFIPGENNGDKIDNTITNSLKIFDNFNGIDTETDYKPYTISEDGEYIYFGSYPQTLKADNVSIVSDTPDADGYYQGSDGERYFKYTVTLEGQYKWAGQEQVDEYINENHNITKNGTALQIGNTYYFKVEPLKWHINSIDKTTNRATLMCMTLVEGIAFQSNYIYSSGKYYATDGNGNILKDSNGNKVYVCNYEYSELRQFLNSQFYNNAFDDVEQSIIQEVKVDNTTTNYNGNTQYACADTYDKVWALAHSELGRKKWGYSEDNVDVYAIPRSDYCIATGVFACNQSIIDGYNNDPNLSTLTFSVYDFLSDFNCLKDGDTSDMTYEDCNEEQKEIMDKIYQSGLGWWTRSPHVGNSKAVGNYLVFSNNVISFKAFVFCGARPTIQIQL